MASDIAINVEVRISDELKSLFGFATDQGQTSQGQVSDDMPPVAQALEPPCWQSFCIRRDGQLPLVFLGLPLLERRCVVDAAAFRTEQMLTLYLSEDGTVYAGLAFEPSETCPARPSYRCQAIHEPADLAHLLREWRPEQWFETAHRNGKRTQHDPWAGLLAARSAFDCIAADCFNPAILQG